MILSVKNQKGKSIVVALTIMAFIALTLFIFYELPVDVPWQPNGPPSLGVDWKGAYRPAALELLRFQNPYNEGLQNAPWVLIPLLPIALLSPELGTAVMCSLGLIGYGFAAFRLGVKPLPMVLFLSSPFVLACIANGNTDWMVALGLTMPPQIGLFLLVLKPQLSIGVVLLWFLEAWQRGKIKEVFRVFAPVTIALLCSFVMFGFWPAIIYGARMADKYNSSLWPAGLPIGVAILVNALRTQSLKKAMVSSPFLAPYITGHGFAIALLGLGKWEMILTILAVWIVYGIL
jgi:hypothetical protein